MSNTSSLTRMKLMLSRGHRVVPLIHFPKYGLVQYYRFFYFEMFDMESTVKQ